MPRVVPADEAKLSTPPGPDLAEMRRRLEAALSRPSKHDERHAETAESDTSKHETETHAPTPQPEGPAAGGRLKPARRKPSATRGEGRGAKSLYDSPERERAQSSYARSENAHEVHTNEEARAAIDPY